MFPFSMDVMFDSDSIVVTSLAVPYPYHFAIDMMFCWGNIALTSKVQGRNDLCDHEKWIKGPLRSLPFELIWDIGKMQQMYCFGIDGMFRSGNFAVTSKVKVKVTMPRSKVGEPK